MKLTFSSSLPFRATFPSRHGSSIKTLILQAGGAFAAYQAGVYSALTRRMGNPDWIVGLSTGAINAALIAGNPFEKRVDRLREFWTLASSDSDPVLPMYADTLLPSSRQWSAAMATLTGISGFFRPIVSPAFILGTWDPLQSYYDASPLKDTLERLVDFDLLNSAKTRLSIGAVNIRSGNPVYFDNTQQKIGPEHIIASSAMPPGFPPVRIGSEDYWDGSISSHAPIKYVLDNHAKDIPLTIIQVDLFRAQGDFPHTLTEAAHRHKDIIQSSHTVMGISNLMESFTFKKEVDELLQQLDPKIQHGVKTQALLSKISHSSINILKLVHHSKIKYHDQFRHDFSRNSVFKHWHAGEVDARNALGHPEWLSHLKKASNGISIFDHP